MNRMLTRGKRAKQRGSDGDDGLGEHDGEPMVVMRTSRRHSARPKRAASMQPRWDDDDDDDLHDEEDDEDDDDHIAGITPTTIGGRGHVGTAAATAAASVRSLCWRVDNITQRDIRFEKTESSNSTLTRARSLFLSLSLYALCLKKQAAVRRSAMTTRAKQLPPRQRSGTRSEDFSYSDNELDFSRDDDYTDAASSRAPGELADPGDDGLAEVRFAGR